jgi:hypothetical protein
MSMSIRSLLALLLMVLCCCWSGNRNVALAIENDSSGSSSTYNDADEALIQQWMDRFEQDQPILKLDPSPMEQAIADFVTQVNHNNNNKKSKKRNVVDMKLETVQKMVKKYKKRKEKIARQQRDAAEDRALLKNKKKKIIMSPEQKKVKGLTSFLDSKTSSNYKSTQQQLEYHRQAQETILKLVGVQGDFATSEGEARKLWDAAERLSDCIPLGGGNDVPHVQEEWFDLPGCAAEFLASLAGSDGDGKGGSDSGGVPLSQQPRDQYATVELLEQAVAEAKETVDNNLSAFSDSASSDVSNSATDMKERVGDQLVSLEKTLEGMADATVAGAILEIGTAREAELQLLEQSRASHADMVANITVPPINDVTINNNNHRVCLQGNDLELMVNTVFESILSGKATSPSDIAQELGRSLPSATLPLQEDSPTMISENGTALLPFNIYHILDTPVLHDLLAGLDWSVESVGGYSPMMDRLIDLVADLGKVCQESSQETCNDGGVGGAAANGLAHAYSTLGLLKEILQNNVPYYDPLSEMAQDKARKLQSIIPGIDVLLEVLSDTTTTRKSTAAAAAPGRIATVGTATVDQLRDVEGEEE